MPRIRLTRPARRHERRVLYSYSESAPVKINGGIAEVVCRTEILARVAERHGFRRVEAANDRRPPVPVVSASASEPASAEPASREVQVEQFVVSSVDDLIDALASGGLDDLLAVVYVAERAGKNRVTALRAILARSREIDKPFDVA